MNVKVTKEMLEEFWYRWDFMPYFEKNFEYGVDVYDVIKDLERKKVTNNWIRNLFEYFKLTGKAKRWHQNGVLSEERYYHQGNGYTKYYHEWHQNGQLAMKFDYVENTCTEWYKDGQIKSVENFEENNHTRHGDYKMWYSHGGLKFHYIYENGRHIMTCGYNYKEKLKWIKDNSYDIKDNDLDFNDIFYLYVNDKVNSNNFNKEYIQLINKHFELLVKIDNYYATVFNNDKRYYSNVKYENEEDYIQRVSELQQSPIEKNISLLKKDSNKNLIENIENRCKQENDTLNILLFDIDSIIEEEKNKIIDELNTKIKIIYEKIFKNI